MHIYRKVKCDQCNYKYKNGREFPCCKCYEIMGKGYDNHFIAENEEVDINIQKLSS